MEDLARQSNDGLAGDRKPSYQQQDIPVQAQQSSSRLFMQPREAYVEALHSEFLGLPWNNKKPGKDELRLYMYEAIGIAKEWADSSAFALNPDETEKELLEDLVLHRMWSSEKRSPQFYGTSVGSLYDALIGRFDAKSLTMMDVLKALQEIPENPRSPKGVEAMAVSYLRSRGKIPVRRDSKG
ncbi:hypothetical protein HYU13_02200 [Candidatus Woesearchaeota archaeon]|nr:hypothetical protein [Candidatus Woesearchaeota archaeon]